MRNLTKRLLELVDENASGEHTIFAKHAGIPTSTFQGYIDGRYPHAKHLIRIRETYRVNINWLLTGVGDKYVKEGSCESVKSVYNNDIEGSCRVAEGAATFKMYNDDPEISGLLDMTSGILTSGTEYSVSLAASIRSFHSAVCMGREIGRLKERVDLLESVFAQCAQKNSAIRQGDPPEKKEDLIKMRGTSSL